MGISITTRAGKGSPLNATEHDANLTNIVSAIENTSTGHDHDGIDSKKVIATNLDVTGLTAGRVVQVNSGETALESGQDLNTTASPTFVTAKLTNLTDGYIPYHISDSSGLGNSGLYYDSSNGRYGIGTTSPKSTLHNAGSTSLAYTTITSSATAGSYTTYFIDASSGEVILTLPSASSCSDRIYHITRIQTYPSSYNCIVACQSGETINGVGSVALENNYDRITVQSNGSGWIIIGR